MPMTPREFQRRVEDVQDALRAEYDAPFCEIAHREFEVPQNPLPEEERESIIEQFKAGGYILSEDSLKLTSDHRMFHDVMRRICLGLDTIDATQVMSAGLAIGRRIGMAEASGLLGSTIDGDVLP